VPLLNPAGRLVGALALATAVACASTPVAPPVAAPGPTIGPAAGTLILAGGGRLHDDVLARFIGLAGGADARIVVIPTAGTDDAFADDWPGYAPFVTAGIAAVSVLHTRHRSEADSDAFVEPLRSATGVWITGGRQWRLADAYLGTRTVRELNALLRRGGVIGGTSAGASIQPSYMVRGAVEGNTTMMAPGYEQGFGLLRDIAIDQHLLARRRENDLLTVIARYPALLGIGIDEGTALVVTGDRADVIGSSVVAFYNAADRGVLPYYFLRSGDTFDLSARRTTAGSPVAPAVVRDELAVIATMNRLFDAMRSQDTAAIRRLAHPELRIFVPGTGNDRPALRVSTLDEFIAQVAASSERLDEAALQPEVRIDGNLATIWTYYEFRRGERFSHCGHDAFHFARADDGWQIVGLAYTTRAQDCTPGPHPSERTP
jgi:cyanophycinase